MGSVCIEIHIFLNLALVGDEWSVSRSGRFTPEERAPSTHLIGGRMGSRARLDYVAKRKFLTLQELELKQIAR
jgi:hypothetical protein